jgi:hypothetical protein
MCSDLIAYSGIGALHSMTKLITNSPYSHVGMIFRLPNKWTRRDDLFVLEVARNNEGALQIAGTSWSVSTLLTWHTHSRFP